MLQRPGSEECISYGMPAFRLHGKLIAGFKAAATYCSFHPMSGETVSDTEGRSQWIPNEPRNHSIFECCWPARHTRPQAREDDELQRANDY